MRRFLAGVAVTVAVLVPNLSTAQVYLLPTPPPQVTAQGAAWQLNGEPVFFSGDFYYPTGPTVFFDGNVMVRSGVYRGVPLYTDSTLLPFSQVLLPIGGNILRPYERKRSGELAGTVGSRMPAFPIERDVEVSASSRATGIQTPPRGPSEPPIVAEAARPVGTTGIVAPSTAPIAGVAPAAARGRRVTIESIPAPRSTAGPWIQFDGARWHTAGKAVAFSAERFTPISEYHGFPVYRDNWAANGLIYIPAVPGGPLTPYTK